MFISVKTQTIMYFVVKPSICALLLCVSSCKPNELAHIENGIKATLRDIL